MRILGIGSPDLYRPAGEEVFLRLRKMILSGELLYGERLVERQLAASMRVSRTPVREALKKLEAEGLVRREPYHGLVVAQITPEDAVEIFRIREVLEGLATRLAALRAGPTQAQVLWDLVGRMEDALRQAEDSAFNQLHVEFHDSIYRAAESPRLYGLLATIREYLHAFTRIGYRSSGRTEQASQEHRELAAQVVAGDPDAAEAAARLHMRNSQSALLSVLGRSETTGSHPGSDAEAHREEGSGGDAHNG